MRFAPSCLSGVAPLCPRQIFRPGKFITAVIDDVVTTESRYDLRSQLLNLDVDGKSGHDYECLQYIGGNHDSQRD